MPENLKDQAPGDRSRIDIEDRWECIYWCRKFNVREAKLREAVNAVGTSAKAVAAHFRKSLS